MENKDKRGPIQYIILAFMLLITFYLTFLYIKSKEFKTYSCYNLIIMSIVIFLGAVVNIFMPKDEGNDGTKFVLGLIKDFFNKIIMSILTMQVIVLYLGIMKTDFYYQREKIMFIVGLLASVAVSVVISILFNSLKFDDGKYMDYLDDYKSEINEHLSDKLERRFYTIIIIEEVFCFVILVINTFCLIVVMNYISKKNKEAKAGLIEDLGYNKQLIRFILIFFLNLIAIAASSVLLVFEVFDATTNQSIYLGTTFIIDLCYSINKTVYNETLKIFCKNKEISENSTELKKKNTFDEEDNGGGDDDED
jgi:hypothetical protein